MATSCVSDHCSLQRLVSLIVLYGAQAARAAHEKNRGEVGGRWLDLRVVAVMELQAALEQQASYGYGVDADDCGCVRVRGLPFTITIAEIIEFFKGFTIAEGGVIIIRKTGVCFIEVVPVRDNALMCICPVYDVR